MINNDEWWELTPSLIKGTPPFNNRHPPLPFSKRVWPLYPGDLQLWGFVGSHVSFQGCAIFPTNPFVLFQRGTKTRLECPDIHGRYIPAAARRDQRNQRRHRQKWRTRHKARKQTRLRLARCLCLWLVRGTFACQKKSAGEWISDLWFSPWNMYKTQPYWLNPGWVIQENRGETYLSCMKKWQQNQCEAVDGGIAWYNTIQYNYNCNYNYYQNTI